MQLDIWGARGGIAVSSPHTRHFGGNTPCVSVRASDGTLLVLDAGTGIHALGQQLNQAAQSPIVHLLLSHFHWDHVQGLPFFAPLWQPRFRLAIYAALPPADTERAVQQQFAAPYFPVSLAHAGARISFHDIRQTQRIGPVQVTPFPQYHPQGSTGFRLDEGPASLVYATDSEAGIPTTDDALQTHAQGAGMLLLDAQYTPQETPLHRGWGHGDWQRASDVAQRGRVQQLVLFHHDPARTDDQLHHIEQQAQHRFAATHAAREGASFQL